MNQTPNPEPTEKDKEVVAEEYEPPVPWDEPDISHDDSTPTIKAQAESQGWKSEYYDFGKVEGQGWDLFNPAIIQRPDGLWLLTRVSEPHPEGFKFGQNNVFAFMLDDTGKVPKMGKRLTWPVDEPRQHFEDPRGFYHPGINQTVIGVCTFLWYPAGSWTGPHQAIGMFDEDWQCKKMDYPRVVGHNLGRMEKIQNHKHYEKNWIWWLSENRLTLLYKANPWMVVYYGQKWGENERFELEGVTWAYGEIRGGTTPIKVGDYYFTFHHSSLPWRGRYRRYYAGCIAFDAKPPFTPRMITSEPLLHGSQNDHWAQRKPLVIFPCGSLYKDGKWLVTCGVNDIKSAWVELSHESLLSKMRPIGDVSDTIFGSNGLSEGEKNLSGGETNVVSLSVGADRDRCATPSIEVALGEGVPQAAQTTLEKHEQGLREDYAKALSRTEEIKSKRQANAAKARAVRAANRIAKPEDRRTPPELQGIQPRKRRRRKRFKRITSEARMKALKEYEKSKDCDVSLGAVDPNPHA